MTPTNTEREDLVKMINDKVYHLELPKILVGLDMETGQYTADDRVVDVMLNWHNKKMEEREKEIQQLYNFRMLYNALWFNQLNGEYDIHKSKRHSDGVLCFDGDWFIVMAELPTGQISNHYHIDNWDLFQIPEKDKANEFDKHTPDDVIKRISKFMKTKGQDDE